MRSHNKAYVFNFTYYIDCEMWNFGYNSLVSLGMNIVTVSVIPASKKYVHIESLLPNL